MATWESWQEEQVRLKNSHENYDKAHAPIRPFCNKDKCPGRIRCGMGGYVECQHPARLRPRK